MNIFLSVPFSSYVDANGSVETAYRQSIERLLANLRAHEHSVYCALEYTEWKVGGLTLPEEELKHDFEEIDHADKIVVLLEEHISAGVQLEGGYAYAQHKVIEIYQIGKSAWSNLAFAKLNGHEIVPVQSIDDFVARVTSSN